MYLGWFSSCCFFLLLSNIDLGGGAALAEGPVGNGQRVLDLRLRVWNMFLRLGVASVAVAKLFLFFASFFGRRGGNV